MIRPPDSNDKQINPVPIAELTGRYLVLMGMDADAQQRGAERLRDAAGVRVTMVGPNDSQAVDSDTLAASEALMFDQLGVAVVNSDPEQSLVLGGLQDGDNAIWAIEPERIVRALDDTTLLDYLRGYRDGVNELVERVLAENSTTQAVSADAPITDEGEFSWGLQATRVPLSRYSGQGVKLAVLDTGLDLKHPDFVGRDVTAQSFVQGEEVQDGHGHGTHCVGIACGPREPSRLPRYGVAYDAGIYVGKVLNNTGRGTDASILAGINWAITNECVIISMSLGTPIELNQTFSQIYETVAKRTLARGCLMIAAAGNESHRPTMISPVSQPGNCPSVMAVAAVDAAFDIALFSNGGLTLQGGQVDIAGPGVNVRSSWPSPTLYQVLSGTSMAAPHVAGIAALFAEANPAVRGGPLGWLLLQQSRRLAAASRDVGVGLVQAP